MKESDYQKERERKRGIDGRMQPVSITDVKRVRDTQTKRDTFSRLRRTRTNRENEKERER